MIRIVLNLTRRSDR